MAEPTTPDPRDTTGAFDRAEIARTVALYGDLVSRAEAADKAWAAFVHTERKRDHWYWRAWWRLHYLPYELAGWAMELRIWLMRHTALGE